MESGDRVMVLDSPGSPLDHYLYATVLSTQSKGALVLIDHPGNVSHGAFRFAPSEKILTAAGSLAMAEETRKQIPQEPDSTRRKQLTEAVKNHELVATQLS